MVDEVGHLHDQFPDHRRASSTPTRSSTTSSPSRIARRPPGSCGPTAEREGPGQREGRLRDDRRGRPRGEGRHPPRRPGQRAAVVSKNVLEGRPTAPRDSESTETLDLAPFRLKPGESLPYWLTVRDNREPASNKAETPKQLIEITAPVSPPSRSKSTRSRRRTSSSSSSPRAGIRASRAATGRRREGPAESGW